MTERKDNFVGRVNVGGKTTIPFNLRNHLKLEVGDLISFKIDKIVRKNDHAIIQMYYSKDDNENQIDPLALVGRRVKHNCGDPNCDLEGTVVDVKNHPYMSLRGEVAVWWPVVQWDAIGDVPTGYTQAVPLSKIKVID